MSSLEHLLTPSLNRTQTLRPLYSVQSHFFVAFFGGPLGVCFFGVYSVKQAGVLSRYQPHYLVLLTLSILFLGGWTWIALYGLPFGITEQDVKTSDIQTWGNRLLGLIVMGGIYLMQKPLFAVSKMEANQPNPWLPGIASVVAGAAMTVAGIVGWSYVI